MARFQVMFDGASSHVDIGADTTVEELVATLATQVGRESALLGLYVGDQRLRQGEMFNYVTGGDVLRLEVLTREDRKIPEKDLLEELATRAEVEWPKKVVQQLRNAGLDTLRKVWSTPQWVIVRTMTEGTERVWTDRAKRLQDACKGPRQIEHVVKVMKSVQEPQRFVETLLKCGFWSASELSNCDEEALHQLLTDNLEDWDMKDTVTLVKHATDCIDMEFQEDRIAKHVDEQILGIMAKLEEFRRLTSEAIQKQRVAALTKLDEAKEEILTMNPDDVTIPKIDIQRLREIMVAADMIVTMTMEEEVPKKPQAQ